MMIVIHIDDNDDMANPYNVDYLSDDTDDDLDEEDMMNSIEVYEACLNISTLYNLI